MITAVPAVTAVTLPAASTLAREASLVLQLPPAAVSVNLMVVPRHMAVGPLMALTTGNGLTVMLAVAEAEQVPLETE